MFGLPFGCCLPKRQDFFIESERECMSSLFCCRAHCGKTVMWLPWVCRERGSGVYGTPAYFTATVLFDLIPMRVLPPCFFAAATYWMIGFRPGVWHLLTFLLLLVLSNMVSENGVHCYKLCGVL